MSILFIAVFTCNALNARLQGSTDDEYDYSTLRTNLGFQCDARDTGCIEEFLERHKIPKVEDITKDNHSVEPQMNKFDFLSLFTGKDSRAELEKRKDYTETVSIFKMIKSVKNFVEVKIFNNACKEIKFHKKTIQ